MALMIRLLPTIILSDVVPRTRAANTPKVTPSIRKIAAAPRARDSVAGNRLHR